MSSWTVTFVIIALIAAILGYGGIAGTASGLAKIVLFVALVLVASSVAKGRRVRA